MEDIEFVFEKYYKYVKSYALSLCCDETVEILSSLKIK